ncbi:MAG: DUF192 domain-containing protein [Candidatus Nanohaloarchaea archaeon]
MRSEILVLLAVGVLMGFVVKVPEYRVRDTEAPSGEPRGELNGSQPAVSFWKKGKNLANVTVEIADNRTERRRGLMHRRELQKGHGMLFVFPDEERRSFWMKNTYIPLDIIFVDGNGTVLNVETAEPQPNATEEELDTYYSEGPAKYVLEVRAGFAENESIRKGVKMRGDPVSPGR